jgi:peptidoglycan/LPS O-acetylase OafA/YrhL
VAILGVLICHGAESLLTGWDRAASSRTLEYTSLGALGVNAFFAISGLLITSRLLDERRRFGSISLKQFYLRRVFRILPASLGFLGVVGVLGLTGAIVMGWGAWFSALGFFRNYWNLTDAIGWYTGHFWSLAVEEHFYLLWPALLAACGPVRLRWLAVVLALAVAVWRIVDYRFGFFAHWSAGSSFYGRTDICMDGLLWGCWLALMLEVPSFRQWLTRSLVPSVWLTLMAGFAFAAVLPVPLRPLWLALLLPLLLAGTVLRPHDAVGWVLETTPLRWIGRISYSLYLWQQLFLAPGGVVERSSLGWLQAWPFNLAALFVCASLSYYLIERPLIRLGRRWAAADGTC